MPVGWGKSWGNSRIPLFSASLRLCGLILFSSTPHKELITAEAQRRRDAEKKKECRIFFVFLRGSFLRVLRGRNSFREWNFHDTATTAQPIATLERRLTGHTDFVWSVAVSPDGKWAASGPNNKIIPRRCY
uniref:WD domain-containing protein, G-beta repeat-containing protein n=1 Tax=Candidatus Kentrum sp. FM TaxID=2126340 RepID=A0A450S4C9_9GAMM|nr:MAG: hypothetical protein BECKFM1743A_GA0114220_1002811 [Candidatus Kentron sp. FM]VFJ46648.1 MAG: hypothetical protein BECKFM1743C_GA0114222_100385 [Candidatus Kentron sp. FM]VFK06847.1 MAG: hypothetical protein BECKFM1743B_GA0114221_1002610 [Candidatus Kentron sp. FM]